MQQVQKTNLLILILAINFKRMAKPLLFLILITLSITSMAQNKIYIIRHAEVAIEKQGWSSAKRAQKYKSDYNNADIKRFNPKLVLEKIDNSEAIDTVFCSPQWRALQTAETLFDPSVFIKVDSNLRELDYQVTQIPLIRLPVKAWLTVSRITWMIGSKITPNSNYKKRKTELEYFVDELIAYTEIHGKSIVIAHGMLNRELIKILKEKGWNLEHNDGLGNLSVNYLTK